MIRQSPLRPLNPIWLMPAMMAALTSCAVVSPQETADAVPGKAANLPSLQLQVQQIALGAEKRFARCDADCRRPSKKTLGGAQQPAMQSSQ